MYMVRCTKMGRLDGETNLKLPKITEKLVEVGRKKRCLHPRMPSPSHHFTEVSSTHIVPTFWAGLRCGCGLQCEFLFTGFPFSVNKSLGLRGSEFQGRVVPAPAVDDPAGGERD